MSDTSTRSGMLWEVERILSECKEKPQVLLMENVPQVKTNDPEAWSKWVARLEEFGYKNYCQDLIATDYGIPQTRNRTFMISILGDYNYNFPKPIPLKLKLKDLLENEVDEKYYLSDKMIKYLTDSVSSGGIDRSESFTRIQKKIEKDGVAATITTNAGNRATDNFIKVKNNTKKGYLEAQEGDCVDLCQPNSETRRGRVQKQKSQTITTMGGNHLGVVVNMKSKLCDELIKNEKVKENDVIRHSYSTSRMKNWKKRNVETNNISPTLDTRCDCLGVVVKGIATNESKEWQKQPLEEKSRTLLANKSNAGVGIIYANLRIRKLTPKECFRLMGVRDEDFEKIAKNQSDISLYHLAGDSIVCEGVLTSIFKEMI